MTGKRLVWLAATLVTLALLTAGEAIAEGTDAKATVKKASDLYRSVGTESETLEVLVVASPEKAAFTKEDAEAMVRDGGRGITHKRAVRKAEYAADHRDKIYVRFSLPAEDKGTGYLVWREAGDGEDKQWLYMPALRRVRRVPVSSTATFVGTNLTYEDVRELVGENVDRYVYEPAGSETLDGADCDVVIAKPGAKTSSSYASRKLWIDKAHAFTLQMEYFDKAGKATKRLRNTGVHEVKPGVFRAAVTEMRDLSLNEATVIWFSQREVGSPVPPETFTVDFLENP